MRGCWSPRACLFSAELQSVDGIGYRNPLIEELPVWNNLLEKPRDHHAYPDADPYDLLREETVQPMATAKPQKEQMKAAAENQFFHLTFGQYVGLNQRPAIKDLVALIRNEDTYETFRAELLRQPVEHEDDASFLTGLKERMDSIEKMRNAVAHNRRPSQKATNDYRNAFALVNQALDDYLGALAADSHDTAAREA
jgi:hypothetical protein